MPGGCSTETNPTNDTAKFAKDLATALSKNCGTYVTSADYSGRESTCVNNSIPTNTNYRSAVAAEIAQSTLDFGGGKFQCVGFVSAVLAGMTGETEFTVGDGGCADYLIGRGPALPQGVFKWVPWGSDKIREGDFPVWQGNDINGCLGHIAVVIAVEGNYAVTVAEAIGTNGAVEIKTRSAAAGWLRRI